VDLRGDCEHVRGCEVIDGAGEREGVGGTMQDVALVRDERTRIEMLWIDDVERRCEI